ncbi:hypothetical protein D3C78_570470 [compost metagenome]
MAKGQGDRRLGFVVLGRGQHLGETHDLAVFVGNLDAHRGLAGDDFHHPHADHGQGTRQVLGQVGNAADLDAGGRLDLETGDHRARMDRLHDHFDAEFLELDFQQAGHGLQGLRGEALLLLLGHVEDGDGRQGAFDGGIDEQRRLLFLLHALARLDGFRRRRRRDDRRRALLALGHVLGQGLLALDQALLDLGLLATIGDHRRSDLADADIHLAQLGHQLLALLARAPPAVHGVLDQLEEIEGDLAGQVHDPEPGQVGEHRQAEQEQREEQQGAALHVQCIDRQVAEALAQRAPRRSRQADMVLEVDIGQRGAGKHQEDQADQAPGKQPAAPVDGFVAMAEDLEGLDRQEQREHVGEVAQGHEQDVGEPGTQPTGRVLHLLDVAGVGPARVGGVVGEQCHPQVEADCPQRDQRTFLEAIMQLLAPDGRLGSGRGILQNASFPAPRARSRVGRGRIPARRYAINGVRPIQNVAHCTDLPARCHAGMDCRRCVLALSRASV